MTTMRISSLNFLVLPFCTISLALLRRDMLFNRLVTVTLIAAVVGFAVTISLAYAGYGPNSMAVGAVATNVVTGMGAWLARSDRQLLLPSFSEWRSLLSFGGQSAAANVVTTISMDINDLALGKMLGFAPVAMISRAQGLMNLFHRDIMSAIRNVAYPTFAKAYRHGDELEPRHAHAVACVTGVAWPFYVFIGLFSVDLLRLMFGDQWDNAAPLVAWFCLAGAAAATCNLVTSLLMAIGRIDLVTKLELIIQPARAALIVLVAFYFRSIELVVVTFAVVFLAAVPVIYHFKGRAIKTDWRALFKSLWKSLMVTTICAFLPILLNQYLRGPDGATSTLILLLALAIMAIAWFCALRVADHPLSREPLYLHFVNYLPFGSVRRYFIQKNGTT
jgi:lipopolysaccharide exporter